MKLRIKQIMYAYCQGLLHNTAVGKTYRNDSVVQTKIKPIKTYLTIVHINIGTRELEKKKILHRKGFQKKSSCRARSFEVPRPEPSGFREADK